MKKIILSMLALIGASASISAQCITPCSTYNTSSIPYSLSPAGGITVADGDDVTSTVPIGFSFPFFCNTYSTAVVSSNGFISMNPLASSGCCSGGILPDAGNILGLIAIFKTDLETTPLDPITYNTIGSSPNRTFVVNYNNVEICCGGSGSPHFGQIKLMETTGVIELHTGSIPNSGNNVTQGIQNMAGTIGYTTAVMDDVGFTASNIAYRYTPVSPTNSVLTGIAPSAISGSNILCASSAALYSVSAIPTATAYAWTLPGGWVGASTTNTISAIPSVTGVMSVTATYSACGTSAASVKSVTVNSLPTVLVNSGAICIGQSFTMTPSGATTYSYSSGSAIVTPTANATYSVIGTSSVTTCSNIVLSSVTVSTVIPTVSVTSGSVCVGSSYTIVASGATTYSFSSGSAVVTPTANTSYSVTGNLLGCASSNTAISFVTVNASPVVTASGSNSIICFGENAILTASTSATSYTWNTGATTMSVSVSPTVTSTYTVSATGINGCVGKGNVTVVVNACTAINEAVASLISFYPNPANGVLNIVLTAELAKNSTLEMYDALGKLVVKQVLTSELNVINISSLNNGIYTFKVLNNANVIKIGKLVKQ